MHRLFHKDEWFDELSPDALTEAEFEAVVLQNASLLLPRSIAIPFKKTAHTPEGSARADLALIAEDYGQWAVVEVELATHSLYGHVLPQVRKLRDADYAQAYVTYIKRQCPRLDHVRLSAMLRGRAPDIFVVVNGEDAEWRSELRRNSIGMIAFRIYRSVSNRRIFSINGEIYARSEEAISELSHSVIPRCLLVDSPAKIPVGPGEQMCILVNNKVTYWERIDTATDVLLMSGSKYSLAKSRRYVLTQNARNQYSIEPVGGPTREPDPH